VCSREHAETDGQRRRWRLRDLHSSTGTRVLTTSAWTASANWTPQEKLQLAAPNCYSSGLDPLPDWPPKKKRRRATWHPEGF